MKLSPHDRKEIDKFCRYLASKYVQVIVQSRLGEKQKTTSRPHSTLSDWFNLNIPSLPEIETEVKRVLGNQTGQVPEPGGPSLCTEISLQTVEGDTLVLETWQLSASDVCDASVRATYTVYSRMGLLLKSLIAVTRVTPAYKLSLRQGPDSYVICYRVYMGEPQVEQLGEGSQWMQVGQVGMPMGTIALKVLFRTKLAISPQRAMPQGNAMMLKSDYFKPDLSPKGLRALGRYIVDNADGTRHDSSAPVDVVKRQCSIVGHNGCSNGHGELEEGVVGFHRGAFAPAHSGSDSKETPYELPEPAFLSLLSPKSASSRTEVEEDDCEGDLKDTLVEPKETLLPAEDFVLVELPPFAEGEEGSTDLGAFFQECQSAPMLSSFSYQPTLEQQVSEINAHLAALEPSLADLDQFVESVCQSDSLK